MTIRQRKLWCRVNRRHQAGMALLSCAVILIVLLMLALATRQMLAESAAASVNAQDRMLAMQAAQAALADAEQVIMNFPDDASMQKNGQNLPVMYGSVTANQLPVGGRMQPIRLPVYKILLQDFSEDLERASTRYQYQVTAVGNGWRNSTQVVLQSEFLKLICIKPEDETCVTQRQGRLSWRELPSLPVQSDAEP